jgi:hypothetical protein
LKEFLNNKENNMPLVYFIVGVVVGTVGVQKIIDIATNFINQAG